MNAERGMRKVREGVVVSDRMQKTIVVTVERTVRHARYRKFIRIRKKYKAHDESSDARVGDRVRIEETRPLSKHKRWKLKAILERSKG